MNNDLLFLSNNDIPFPEARLTIHNPTIKEISLIGEESFHPGSRFLTFSKDQLPEQDKNGLSNKSDFDIFMSIMCSKEKAKYKNDAIMVLTLLFPEYEINFDERRGICFKGDNFVANIDDRTFDIFKDIVNAMFVLEEEEKKDGFNPADARAEKIAKKIQAARDRKAKKEQMKKGNKISIFNRYISILAVGESKDINELMNYTVYQLKDEFKRYRMKQDYDIYIEARMAGAKDLDEVENWMEDIH